MNTGELLAALERGERERKAVEVAGHRFTSLHKVLWPREGYTKGDLVRYYVRVADAMVPHLEGRPLMLKRYHEGIEGRPIFQQRVSPVLRGRARTATVPTAEGEPLERYIGSRATLLFAVQMNAIELHPWHSRLGSLDRPDWVVLDLDPSPGAGFRKVVRVARWLRDRLDDLGLKAVVKTSGSRGLHLYIPAGRRVGYDDAAELARRLAEAAAAAEPAFATVQRSLGARGPHVYVDHLQNARGKTAVAPYSVRARPGAPVSAPVDWEEVTERLEPRGHTIRDVPSRLESGGDPWRVALRTGNDVAAALERLRREAGSGGRRAAAD